MAVTKAELRHIEWKGNQEDYQAGDSSKTVKAHFNPQSLKVTYQNQSAGGGQPGGSSRQRTGNATTKLAVELLFDTTDKGTDVRELSDCVAFFIRPDEEAGSGSDSNRVPPAVLFAWGSFLFPGVMDSMDETLDYFSENGVPLRATISLSITRQSLKVEKSKKKRKAGGSEQLKNPQFKDTVQAVAARNGNPDDWKKIAAANNIDDPLRLKPGSLINVSKGAGVGGGLSAGAGLSAGVSISGGAGASLSVSGGAGVSASALAKASAGAGVSARAAASASVGAQAKASAGGSLSGGAGLKAGR